MKIENSEEGRRSKILNVTKIGDILKTESDAAANHFQHFHKCTILLGLEEQLDANRPTNLVFFLG